MNCACAFDWRQPVLWRATERHRTMDANALPGVPAFDPGAAAPQVRSRGRPRKARCPGRQRQRDRGHGLEVPRECHGVVGRACCAYCPEHCECNPEAVAAGEAQVAAGAAGAAAAAVAAPARRSRRTSVAVTPVAGPARSTSEIVADETSEAADKSFNHNLTWDAEGFRRTVPLKSGGATMNDVREYFGFDETVGNHGMGTKRKAFEPLEDSHRVRQHQVLDKVATVITTIMNRKVTSDEVKDIVQGWHEQRARSVSEDEEQQLVANAVTLLESVPSTTQAGVALRALLVKSIGQSRLRELTDKHSIRHSKEARADFEQISQSGVVPERKATRKSIPDAVILTLVRWLLSSDNIVMLSWGKKKARLDGAVIEIPCVSRKRSKPTMMSERTAKPMKKWMEAEGEIAPGGQWPKDDDERGPSCKQVESVLVRWRSAAASGAAAAAATPGDGQPLDDPDGDL